MLSIVKKNDSYDVIEYKLENEDGSAIDLTGASVKFVMGKKNKLITNAAATILSSASGIVSYKLTPSDTLITGTFLGEFVVTFKNGTQKTYPSNGYITVDVQQNLDTTQQNIVVDMIATKQGDFESKLDSILRQGIGTQVSAMNEYTWVATTGQIIFVFPSNAKYDPSVKWFQVSVGNVPVDNSLVNRASATQFSLAIDPSFIEEGMKVRALWVEPIVPITGGHHSTHEINGQDEIDVTKLRNYKESISDKVDLLTSNLADIAKDIEPYPLQSGETDDSGRLQRALNDCAGNYRLVIPKGKTYIISKELSIPSNSHLIINGTIKLAPNIPRTDQPNTVLNMLSTAYTDTINKIGQSSNIVIEGTGVIDGDRSNQTLQADGDFGTNGIKLLAASNVTIREIEIKNIPNTGFLASSDNGGNGSSFVLVDGVYIHHSKKSSRFEYYTTHDCSIVNSVLHDVDNDSGFTVYNGAYRCQVIGNKVYSAGADGIAIYNDYYDANGKVHDVIVKGNICYNNQQNGIGVGSAQAISVNNENVVIDGNICYNNNQSNLNGGLGGIKVYSAKNVTISNNIVHENGNGSQGATGITASSPKINVIGNIVFNEGKDSTVGQGIIVNTDGIIEGNQVYDDQSTRTMLYGLNIVGGNTIVKNNNLGSTWVSGGGALNNPNNAKIVSDNIGFNPVGKITAPTLPLSGNVYTNPFSYPVRVFIAGGTVTFILINGEDIGLKSGSFVLSKGETITISYTATPVWFWYGL